MSHRYLADDFPVLVGVSQLIQRDAEPSEALDPLSMLVQIARGLVTGNGWYLTKHAALVLSTEAPGDSASLEGGTVDFEAPGAVVPLEAAEGSATVETYTAKFGRDGRPERGIVIGRLDGGERFIANTPSDPALIEELVARERIGTSGRVTHRGDLNTFTPA